MTDYDSFKIRLAWLVPWDEMSYSLFMKNPMLLTHPSPTWYTISRDGDILGTADEMIINTAKKFKLRLIPLISNHEKSVGFSRALFQDFISNRSAIDNFISQLKYLKRKFGYSGFNLDFENIPPATSTKLVALLREIKSELPDIELSIDVPPRVDSVGLDWFRAFDYSEISKVVDFIVIMAYDYHYATSSPGPVTPTFWLRQVINYAKFRVPLEKIVIGLPLYGYDWAEDRPGVGVSVFKAEELLKASKASRSMDNESLEYYFEYFDDNNIRHTVFYQNYNALKNRLKILAKASIQGIAFWYWGAAPLEWFI
ncbi:MAG: glycosyl hydrolase family 18 protein [Candidatus Asgardarchaeia archaeon]